MIHDKLEKESISSLTITHLEILITKFTKLNHEVTIGTDANVAFKSNAGDIARLCKKCQLIDPISTKYRTKGEPNTYTRGLGQIYYFFCTRIIFKFIKKCGILPFCSIVTSDHRGLYMDDDIIQYLRNPCIDLILNHTRLLSSTHSKNVSQYKKVLIEYISSRNSNEKETEIQNKINNKGLHESDMKDINKLDITITKGALFSEKKLKKALHNSQ